MQRFLVIAERLHHHPDLRPTKVQRAGADGIEQAVHGDKGPSVAGGRREDATGRKAAMQAPGEKDRLADGMQVGQPSRMEVVTCKSAR